MHLFLCNLLVYFSECKYDPVEIRLKLTFQTLF